MHARVADAIKKRRPGSAQDLADKTAELGYPISRAQIANYESGRKKNLDIAELLILAAALDIPPVLLLFPSFPVGTVELLPDDREATGYQAVRWLAGERALPARRIDRERGISEEPVNVGTQLVAAVRERDRLSLEHLQIDVMGAREDADQDTTKRLLRSLENQMATVNARITDLCEQLGVAGAGDALGGGWHQARHGRSRRSAAAAGIPRLPMCATRMENGAG